VRVRDPNDLAICGTDFVSPLTGETFGPRAFLLCGLFARDSFSSRIEKQIVK
jgi:hypothetical protein